MKIFQKNTRKITEKKILPVFSVKMLRNFIPGDKQQQEKTKLQFNYYQNNITSAAIGKFL